jgi:hypothetical protein
MRKLVRAGAVIVGAAGLSVAGIAAAYANWTVSSAPVVVELSALTMPTFASAPTVQPQGRRVMISWAGQNVEKGVKVERYIVARHDSSGRRAKVCDTAADTCRDAAVPDGAWTYTVRTVHASWQGPDSPASVPVKIGTTAASPGTRAVTPEVAAVAAPQPPAATTATPSAAADSAAATDSPPRPPATSEPDEPDPSPTAASTPDATATREPAAPTDTATSTATHRPTLFPRALDAILH